MKEVYPVRDSIRRSLRKWIVGAGCAVSVALLLQHAKNSDAFQTVNGATEDAPAIRQNTESPQDPVTEEWQTRRRGRVTPDARSDDSSSFFGGPSDRSSGSSGFRTRTSHS